MSLVQKRYKKLVKELVFVYTELEFVKEVLADAHSDFEAYYQRFCAENDVPLTDLNEKHKERIEEVIPHPKKQEVDEEGIIKVEASPEPPPPKIHKVFTKMYRMVTSRIHPDKFAGREETPEIKEKILMFKDCTKSYNDRNWGKFLDICEKLDIMPTRYEGVSSVIRDEISDINKKIVNGKRAFSWKLYECEEDDSCKDKVIKDFLFQLFKYKA
jgi:hypothetical protein